MTRRCVDSKCDEPADVVFAVRKFDGPKTPNVQPCCREHGTAMLDALSSRSDVQAWLQPADKPVALGWVDHG